MERSLREKLGRWQVRGVSPLLTPAAWGRSVPGQPHDGGPIPGDAGTPAGVRGWTLQTTGLAGKPDIFFPDHKVAVFLDGCYWHGCPRFPVTSRPSTAPSGKRRLRRNQQRDRVNNAELKGSAVRVLRFWEHELREEGGRCLERLKVLLEQGSAGAEAHKA